MTRRTSKRAASAQTQVSRPTAFASTRDRARAGVSCARFRSPAYSWRHQIGALARRLHAVAPDMRGRQEHAQKGRSVNRVPSGGRHGRIPMPRGRTAVIVGHDWAHASHGSRPMRPDASGECWAQRTSTRGKVRPPAPCRRRDPQFSSIYSRSRDCDAELGRDPRLTIRRMLFGGGRGCAAARTAAAAGGPPSLGMVRRAAASAGSGRGDPAGLAQRSDIVSTRRIQAHRLQRRLNGSATSTQLECGSLQGAADTIPPYLGGDRDFVVSARAWSSYDNLNARSALRAHRCPGLRHWTQQERQNESMPRSSTSSVPPK